MRFPLAGLIVFVTSFCVLLLEILASRLLAPWLGTTLETYTAIIGTVLAGMSLGTWVGGRWADAVPVSRLVPALLAVGGCATLAALPVLQWLASANLGEGPAVAVTFAGAAFFVPAALISAVSPAVARACLATAGSAIAEVDDSASPDARSGRGAGQRSRAEGSDGRAPGQFVAIAHAGRTVGQLSAIGTLGALLGTFATGFYLVGRVASSRLLSGTAVVLLGLAGLSWMALGRARPQKAMIVLLPVGIACALGAARWKSPCLTESRYFCSMVLPDPSRPGFTLLKLDSTWHSTVNLQSPSLLGMEYARVIFEALEGRPLARVVHIGGGGFQLARALAHRDPHIDQVILELDPELLPLAHDHLGLPRPPPFLFIAGDARQTLRALKRASAQAIIGDAFGSESVPWHLTTFEFLKDVRKVLVPGGLYAMNVIDVPPFRFAAAEYETLRATFANVLAVAATPPLGSTNVVLLASDEELPRVSAHALTLTSASVLTDDFAPVDQLLHR